MDFFIRLTSLIKKELLAVLRDKKSRLALIIPPVLQICIFGYAATMNVTRVPYAVLDKDGGELAAQYIADLEGTGIFRRQATAATEKDIDSLIDSRDIVLGLTFTDDVLMVYADLGKIQQVLYNLVDNAICKRGGPPRSSSLETAETRTPRPSPSATPSKSPPTSGRNSSPKTQPPPRLK